MCTRNIYNPIVTALSIRVRIIIIVIENEGYSTGPSCRVRVKSISIIKPSRWLDLFTSLVPRSYEIFNLDNVL